MTCSARLERRPRAICRRLVASAATATLAVVATPAVALAETDACTAVVRVVTTPVGGEQAAQGHLAPLNGEAAAGRPEGLSDLVTCLHSRTGGSLDQLVRNSAGGDPVALGQLSTLMLRLHGGGFDTGVLATVIPHVNAAQEAIGSMIATAPAILRLVVVREEVEASEGIVQPASTSDVASAIPAGTMTTVAPPTACRLSTGMTVTGTRSTSLAGECFPPFGERRRMGYVTLSLYNVYGDKNFDSITDIEWWYDYKEITNGQGDYTFVNRADSVPGLRWRLDEMAVDEEYSYQVLANKPTTGWAVKKTPVLQGVVTWFAGWNAVIQEERPWTKLYGHYDGTLESEHMPVPKDYTCYGQCT